MRIVSLVSEVTFSSHFQVTSFLAARIYSKRDFAGTLGLLPDCPSPEVSKGEVVLSVPNRRGRDCLLVVECVLCSVIDHRCDFCWLLEDGHVAG